MRDAVLEHRHADLANYEELDAGAAMSVPTPEHYLPLLYVLALQRPGESVSLPVDGIELGAVSMMCVQVGGAAGGEVGNKVGGAGTQSTSQKQ